MGDLSLVLGLHVRRLVLVVNVLLDELLAVLVRSSDGRVSVQQINLLETETLALGNEEVGEYEAEAASTTPDEEDGTSETSVSGSRVDEVRGRVSNGKVDEPVRGGRHGHGLSSNRKGVDLGRDDPCEASPGRGEEGDEEAHEGDEDPLACKVGGCNRDSDGSYDKLRDGHSGGSDEEERSSSVLVDGPDSGNGHDDIDDVGDDGNSESLSDSGVEEVLSTVIEDKVDTSELLESLNSDSGPHPHSILSGSVAEAVGVGDGSDRSLSVQVGSNVGKLSVNLCAVDRGTQDSRESLHGLLVASLHDQPPRRLWQEGESSGKDGGPDDLKSDGDSVAVGAVDELSSVDDDSGNEKSPGDSPLVTSDNGSSNVLGSALGLVHGNKARSSSDTKTSKDTSNNEGSKCCSTGLESDSNAEDYEVSNDSVSTSKRVSDGVGQKGTNKGSG